MYVMYSRAQLRAAEAVWRHAFKMVDIFGELPVILKDILYYFSGEYCTDASLFLTILTD